jgi:hypothetical protein
VDGARGASGRATPYPLAPEPDAEVVISAAVAGLIVFPAMHWGHITPGFSISAGWGVVVAGAALGASSFVTQLVTGAVVAAAILRAEGQPVDVRRALAVA